MAELTGVILAQSDSIKTLQAKSDAVHTTVEEIKSAVLELQKWKPEMETSVEGLRSEVGELRMQVGQIARNPVLALRRGDLPPLLPLPKTKQEPATEIDRTPVGKEGNARVRGDYHTGSISQREELAYRGRTIGE